MADFVLVKLFFNTLPITWFILDRQVYERVYLYVHVYAEGPIFIPKGVNFTKTRIFASNI